MNKQIDREAEVRKIVEDAKNRIARQRGSVDFQFNEDLSEYLDTVTNPGAVNSETAAWRAVKKVQHKLRGSRVYDHLYRHAIKLKAVIPKYQDKVSARDLLRYRDREFIQMIYKRILKRDPDPQGGNYYLQKLREGSFDKEEIIGRLRYSREGREKGVTVHGLSIRFAASMFSKIPLIGYVANILASIVRLPKIVVSIRQADAFSAERYDHVQLLTDENSDKIRSLKDDLHELGELTATKASQQSMDGTAAEVRESKLRLQELRLNIIDHEKRLLSPVNREPARADPGISREGADAAKSASHSILNAFYLSFENRFRGSREEIKDRLKVYLPYLPQTAEVSTSPIILDIGCGRGEWLELLREKGYTAKGIDNNSVMIAQCNELGFQVEEADAIEYLTRTQSNAYRMITGIQLLEHFPFDRVLMILDEAYRTLCVNGVALFELPNPGNIVVATHNFYMDPSHQKPIPSALLKFAAETVGFSNIAILPLHPYPDSVQLSDTEIQRRFSEHFYSAQDYALIGYKQ
jgi:O-antigen chain-terminating methyltransferase